jgi:hypothetical protein
MPSFFPHILMIESYIYLQRPIHPYGMNAKTDNYPYTTTPMKTLCLWLMMTACALCGQLYAQERVATLYTLSDAGQLQVPDNFQAHRYSIASDATGLYLYSLGTYSYTKEGALK